MFKLFTLTLALLSCTGAISQNAADTVITTPPDSIAKVIAADSNVNKNTAFTDTVKPKQVVPTKLAEHAPEPNDPNYAEKKKEWIKKYPKEYQFVNSGFDTTKVDLSHSGAIINIQAVENIKDSTTVTANVAEQHPSAFTPIGLTDTIKNDIPDLPIIPTTFPTGSSNVAGISVPPLDDYPNMPPQDAIRIIILLCQHEIDSLKTLSGDKEEIKLGISSIQRKIDSLKVVLEKISPSSHVLQPMLPIYPNNDSIMAINNELIAQKTLRLNDSIRASETDTNQTAVPKKVGEHAPDYNDPDYENKKAEWINKYPDEYKKANYAKPITVTDEQKQKELETLKDNVPLMYDEMLQNYRINDPNFYQKHIEWLKTNDPERYKLLK